MQPGSQIRSTAGTAYECFTTEKVERQAKKTCEKAHVAHLRTMEFEAPVVVSWRDKRRVPCACVKRHGTNNAVDTVSSYILAAGDQKEFLWRPSREKVWTERWHVLWGDGDVRSRAPRKHRLWFREDSAGDDDVVFRTALNLTAATDFMDKHESEFAFDIHLDAASPVVSSRPCCDDGRASNTYTLPAAITSGCFPFFHRTCWMPYGTVHPGGILTSPALEPQS